MEIGSIYEIDPKTVADEKLEDAAGLQLREVRKYKKEHIKYTASGREAIALVLKSMEEKNPDIVKKCLLPGYMCDTVFFPFIHAGWELYFYHIEKNLEVKKEHLLGQIELIRPGLLFIHPYYGVDTWKPMRSLLKVLRNQGIYIMEDVTQSYYLEEAGREADYVIGSLRKWYPVPDGGFAASHFPLSHEKLEISREFTTKRLDLLTEKWEYLYGTSKLKSDKTFKEGYLRKNRETEEWLDQFVGINAISETSSGILQNIEETECKQKRNENYKVLYEGLKGLKNIELVFEAQKVIEAPLYFPIYVKNREKLQVFLQKHHIYAPVLWPIGKENKDKLSETEDYIFNHLLAIPMDQRYGRDEMETIVALMNIYEKM